MTPTLFGRMQTRVFLVAVIGALWTLIVTPFLPMSAPLGDKYEATFRVLATVLVLGLAWELLYHLFQQFRWEKDWTAFFGLLTGINEGILVWVLLRGGVIPGDPQVGAAAFTVHFVTTWVVTWLFVNGPMRVPFLRWRFRGGRII